MTRQLREPVVPGHLRAYSGALLALVGDRRGRRRSAPARTAARASRRSSTPRPASSTTNPTAGPEAATRRAIGAIDSSARALDRSVEGLRPFALAGGGRGVNLQGGSRARSGWSRRRSSPGPRAAVSATIKPRPRLPGRRGPAGPAASLRSRSGGSRDLRSPIGTGWRTPDLLMEPAIGGGVPIGDLDLTLEQLRDIGWSLGSSNVVIQFDDVQGEGFFAPEPLGSNRRNAIMHVAEPVARVAPERRSDPRLRFVRQPRVRDDGAVLAQAGPQFIYESFAALMYLDLVSRPAGGSSERPEPQPRGRQSIPTRLTSRSHSTARSTTVHRRQRLSLRSVPAPRRRAS